MCVRVCSPRQALALLLAVALGLDTRAPFVTLLSLVLPLAPCLSPASICLSPFCLDSLGACTLVSTLFLKLISIL